MPINALLVRWSGGWSEYTDADAIAADGRREALLGLGAIQSEIEVERVATAQLAIYAPGRTEIAADIEPIDETDLPYVAFRPGDRVVVPAMTGGPSTERVGAVTIAEDDNGQVTAAVEMKDPIMSRQEALDQAIKKMTDGTLDGTSKVATPVVAFTGLTTGKDCCPPAVGGVARFVHTDWVITYGNHGQTTPTGETSGPWWTLAAGVVTITVTGSYRLRASITDPPANQLGVEVQVNGTGTPASATVTGGGPDHFVELVSLTAGDELTLWTYGENAGEGNYTRDVVLTVTQL